MPRRVDYTARFAFFREAAFEIVRHEGVAALSRARLGATLGTSEASVRRILDPSAHLAQLAGDHVVELRRRDRWRMAPSAAAPDATTAQLLRFVPVDGSQIIRERVWWRLLTAMEEIGRTEGPGPDLAHRFRVAQDGWAPGPAPGAAASEPDAGVISAALAHHVAAHDEDLRHAAALVCEHGSADLDPVAVRALVEGLSWAVCCGDLHPDGAHAALVTALSGPDRGPASLTA